MSGKKSRPLQSFVCRMNSVLSRTGDTSGGIPPDPIPNSAVKASSAYGTAAQAAGESVVASPAKDRIAITCQVQNPVGAIRRGFCLSREIDLYAEYIRRGNRKRPVLAALN